MRSKKSAWMLVLGLCLGTLAGIGGTVIARPQPASGGFVLSAKTPAYVIAGGKASVKILLDKASVGAKEAYLGVLTALPGTKVPVHRHKESAELIYVLEGQGKMTLGKRVFRVKQGMAIYIPPNTPHSLHVDTQVQPLKVVQVYAKPGPEQRFKKGKKAKE